MRSLILLTLVGLSLSSCNFIGAPKEPDFMVCGTIILKDAAGNVDWLNSYALCRDHKNPTDVSKELRINIIQYLVDTRPFMVAPEAYTDLQTYAQDLEIWGQNHCK